MIETNSKSTDKLNLVKEIIEGVSKHLGDNRCLDRLQEFTITWQEFGSDPIICPIVTLKIGGKTQTIVQNSARNITDDIDLTT